MEEAFIAAAEKDDIITEEMAAAIRGTAARSTGGAVAVDAIAVDISEGLFLDDDDDLDDEDYVDDGEDQDDDSV